MIAKPVVAGLILILLTAPLLVEARNAIGPEETWRTTVANIAPHTVIEVTLTDGTHVRGRFVDVAGDVLRLRPEARARRPRPDRSIPVQAISAVEVVRTSDAAFVQAGQLDLSAGYLNTNDYMHGVNVQVSVVSTPHLSVVGEVDESYGSECSGCLEKFRDIAALGGVRIAWHPTPRVSPFVQTLAGVLHSSEESYYDTEPFVVNYFAVQPGGGVTVMLTPRWGLRAQYDSQLAFVTEEDLWMSIFPRFAVGAVIRLGAASGRR